MNYDGLSYGGGQDFSYGGGGGGQDFSYDLGGGGGGGEGSGGGWMNSGGGGGGGGGDDNKARGGYKNQTLRPVTIKQLSEVPVATGDMPILVDGEEIKQVTFVGVVRNVSPMSVNVTYLVEDGTGKIDVRMWLNSSSEGGGSGGGEGKDHMLDPAIATGKYVRVYGELKFFNNARHVNAHKIRAVTDHNEIAYHGLEATYVHLVKTRGPAAAAGAAAGGPGHAPGGAFAGAGSGLSPVHAAILDAIKQAPRSPEGVSIDAIQAALGGRFHSGDVTAAVDWLIGEGHLFTTIDENHLQSLYP
ncbi:Replication factor A protein 2 [Coemansia javaensis]|uniref:Replication factor A protein 2 n=1 Tax=Coemansia javaensis TaxID=2761396 RepID=A0A9W8LJI8_9FUNG|nr:Replication factor A protein 2 [Coemansia javaensis]